MTISIGIVLVNCKSMEPVVLLPVRAPVFDSIPTITVVEIPTELPTIVHLLNTLDFSKPPVQRLTATLMMIRAVRLLVEEVLTQII